MSKWESSSRWYWMHVISHFSLILISMILLSKNCSINHSTSPLISLLIIRFIISISLIVWGTVTLLLKVYQPIQKLKMFLGKLHSNWLNQANILGWMKKISCNNYGSGRKNPEKFCLGIKLLKSWEYKDIVSCAIPSQNLNQMDYNMLIYN
jgi:hypothetical protein